MTRIVAGVAGGRSIDVPPRGTRPTSDRVREALFSRLEHYGVLRDARVLDLFAGSGALGLEAASRGAAHVTLIERARTAAQVCRTNIAKLRLASAELLVEKAETYVATVPEQPWDLVLIDPPYDIDEVVLERVLTHLAHPDALAEGAVVVVERARRSPQPPWIPEWELLARRDYGDTSLWFAGPPLPAEPA